MALLSWAFSASFPDTEVPELPPLPLWLGGVLSCKDVVQMEGFSPWANRTLKAPGVAMLRRCMPERRKTHFLLGPGPAWPWALTATLMGIFPVVHSQGSSFHVAQDQVPSAKEYVNYTCFNHFRYVCVCVCVCVYIYKYKLRKICRCCLPFSFSFLLCFSPTRLKHRVLSVALNISSLLMFCSLF